MRTRSRGGRGSRKPLHAAFAGTLLALAIAGAAAAAENGSLAWAIKATYLYKFAPFVEWPADAFPSPASPLLLCVVGDDPFGELLERATSGQHVGAHAIAVRRLRVVDRGSGCRILYAAGSAAQNVGDILDAVRGTPVLTVTDAASGPHAKGIIQFMIIDEHVRFEIDTAAAAANRLTISSKLLSLAVNIERGG